MRNIHTQSMYALGLFFGDMAVLSLSLIATLFIRYLAVPTVEQLGTHFSAFIWLFLLWAAVFFIAGFYDRQSLVLQQDVSVALFRAYIFNASLSILFFYTIPFFSITPKTNLFIFLLVSFAALFLWRRYTERAVFSLPVGALLLVAGKHGSELQNALGNNGAWGLRVKKLIDPQTSSASEIEESISRQIPDIKFVVIDSTLDAIEPLLSRLYELLHRSVFFIEFDDLYETVLARVPLSRLESRWFLTHIKNTPHAGYDFLKRFFDIIISACLLVLSSPVVFVVWLGFLLTSSNSFLYKQTRVGQYGDVIDIFKIRTMREISDRKQVTKLGWWLRKTRIDEVPQLWSVIKGDLSLIGPRPETPKLARAYYEEIPFYNARHFIKPGLSGWAQLKHADPPKFKKNIKKTKEKLSYDLYYVKHRSLWLDIKVALWTLRVLASQSGK